MSGEEQTNEGTAPIAANGRVDRNVRPLEWMPILGLPLMLSAKLLSDEWAMRNHCGQDLAALARRGGICLSEAAAIAMRRPYKPMLNDEALADLKRAAERAA